MSSSGNKERPNTASERDALLSVWSLEEVDNDQLAELPKFKPTKYNAVPSSGGEATSANKGGTGASAGSHLKTYTAGEDNSRLAAAARELGLQKSREPRRQVRQGPHSDSLLFSLQQTRRALHLLLDSGTEDARMLSVYSSHAARSRQYDEETSMLWGSLPELAIGQERFKEGGEEEAGAGIAPTDGHEVTGGSLTAAVLGIIKGMVGPAILYLPNGFSAAGYMIALPIMALTTCLFLYSSSCLLSTWRTEHDKERQKELQRRKEGGRKAPVILLSYPELAYRGLGARGESIVKTGIALMQSGVCLTYLIFVPQNLHVSAQTLFGVNISTQVWLLVMIGIQIPLSWIRDIRKLTPTNLLANMLILYGLVTCLGFAVLEATTASSPLEITPNETIDGDSSATVDTTNGVLANLWYHLSALKPVESDWFLFIGTSVLLFEGSITLLVPLQEAVNSAEQRKQFPSVYQRVILGIMSFYVFFGITCWMAFGQDVNVVLTTSLPTGVLATTVQLAYSIAVIFTFPLQNFPALEITCRTIQSLFHAEDSSGVNDNRQRRRRSSLTSRKSLLARRNVISSVLVALLAVVAVCTMDSLDKVVSLMGSLLGCPIAFIFPPLIHSYLTENLTTTRLWINRMVASLGVVAMVVASSTTIMKW